jgi:uncharacterized protein (TIGR00369 family)
MDQSRMEWNVFRKSLEQSARGTFWELLGCKLEEISEQRVVVTLSINKKHLNGLGIVHGGVHATLLDSAMGLAAMAVRPGEKIMTTHLNIHYVSALKEGDLIVTAQAVHQTRNMVTTQGTVTNPDGELAALATATFRVKNTGAGG